MTDPNQDPQIPEKNNQSDQSPTHQATTPQVPNVQEEEIKKRLRLNNLPDLLTVREVAQILRVSPLTIKRWGKRGKLPAIRINSRGDRRYKKEQVLWLLGMQEAV